MGKISTFPGTTFKCISPHCRMRPDNYELFTPVRAIIHHVTLESSHLEETSCASYDTNPWKESPGQNMDGSWRTRSAKSAGMFSVAMAARKLKRLSQT